jgi:hypothetical protein
MGRFIPQPPAAIREAILARSRKRERLPKGAKIDTLSAALRKAQALVETLSQHGAPEQAILKAYAEEVTLAERMERAHQDPLVAIMRSVAKRSQHRRLAGIDPIRED